MRDRALDLVIQVRLIQVRSPKIAAKRCELIFNATFVLLLVGRTSVKHVTTKPPPVGIRDVISKRVTRLATVQPLKDQKLILDQTQRLVEVEWQSGRGFPYDYQDGDVIGLTLTHLDGNPEEIHSCRVVRIAPRRMRISFTESLPVGNYFLVVFMRRHGKNVSAVSLPLAVQQLDAASRQVLEWAQDKKNQRLYPDLTQDVLTSFGDPHATQRGHRPREDPSEEADGAFEGCI